MYRMPRVIVPLAPVAALYFLQASFNVVRCQNTNATFLVVIAIADHPRAITPEDAASALRPFLPND